MESIKSSRYELTMKEPFLQEGYLSEQFTEEETQILKCFFSNVDQPVFVIYNLPEEVIGSLSSLYSRSTKSMRRTFLDNFALPILHSDIEEVVVTEELGTLPESGQKVVSSTKSRFASVIKQISLGYSTHDIANTEKGRQFYERWLGLFGDHSIAEQAGFHVGIEGVSQMVMDYIKLLNLPHISKSSRYVSFSEKDVRGKYNYFIPPEVVGTEFEERFVSVTDRLYDLYASLEGDYTSYIENLYPIGVDLLGRPETKTSFRNSRRARALDDLRSLLTQSSKTNAGLYANARTYGMMINIMVSSPLIEVRSVGRALYRELHNFAPSLLSHIENERGNLERSYQAGVDLYKDNVRLAGGEVSQVSEFSSDDNFVDLISTNPARGGENLVLAALMFSKGTASFKDALNKAKSLSRKERKKYFDTLWKVREQDLPEVTRQSVRMREVPREFELVSFIFEGLCMGGDLRDLLRHRYVDWYHQPFTTEHGYLLEKDLRNFSRVGEIRDAIASAHHLYLDIAFKLGRDVAQYVVPFAYLQQFVLQASLRQIHWIGELRSGPQGRMHYKKIMEQIYLLARERFPGLFGGMKFDSNFHPISRRESERRFEDKKKKL